MYDEHDEISLRDLYLTLRRGMPLVIILTVAAGALGVLFASLGGKRYESAATVQIAPIAMTSDAPGSLDLSNATTVDFETYQALAFSPAVVAAARDAFGPDAPANSDFRHALTLKRLSGASTVTLVVQHGVNDTNAERAAAVANAWAAATRDAVQSTVSAALDDVASSVDVQTNAARSALDTAEAAWETFQKEDARADIRSRMLALGTRDTEGRQRLDELTRLTASATAQQQLLIAIVASEDTGAAGSLESLLQGLEANGVVDPEVHDDLLQALSAAGIASTDGGVSLNHAIAQARLQQQTTALAGYVAEQAAIERQLKTYDAQSTELRAQLAQLERTAADLGRALSVAQSRYDGVLALSPQLSTISKLSASSARVLDEAVAPDRPQPRHRVRAAIAAAAAGFVLAIFLVFLRAAIADPTAGGGPDRRTRRPIAAPADAVPHRSER